MYLGFRNPRYDWNRYFNTQKITESFRGQRFAYSIGKVNSDGNGVFNITGVYLGYTQKSYTTVIPDSTNMQIAFNPKEKNYTLALNLTFGRATKYTFWSMWMRGGFSRNQFALDRPLPAYYASVERPIIHRSDSYMNMFVNIGLNLGLGYVKNNN